MISDNNRPPDPLLFDVGFARLAPTKETKARRLWKWAVLTILEQKQLEAPQKSLIIYANRILNRLGKNKKGTRVCIHYMKEIMNIKAVRNQSEIIYKPREVKYNEGKEKQNTLAVFIENDSGQVVLQKNSFVSFNSSYDLLFVVDHAGRLYIEHARPFFMHHSSILSGHPVFAAGMMEVSDDGIIKAISNQSGHYLPKTSSLMVRYLLSKKIDLEKIEIKVISDDFSDSYSGNAFRIAKNLGEITYQNYVQDMKNLEELKDHIAGALELHLPLLYKESITYPIHIASSSECNPEVMEFLLECGCNPNSFDGRGNTPLGILCESEKPNLELIEKLIESNASIHQPHGAQQLTPLQIARNNNNHQLVELLESYERPESEESNEKVFLVKFNTSKPPKLFSDYFEIPYGSNTQKVPLVLSEEFELYAGLSKCSETAPFAKGEMIVENGTVTHISNEVDGDPEAAHLLLRYLSTKMPLDDLMKVKIEIHSGGALEFTGFLKEYLKEYGEKNYEQKIKEIEIYTEQGLGRPQELRLPVLYQTARGSAVRDSSLHVAIKEGMPQKTLEKLVQVGCNPNEINSNGYPPLSSLVNMRRPNIETTELLLKLGAHPLEAFTKSPARIVKQKLEKAKKDKNAKDIQLFTNLQNIFRSFVESQLPL